jgi:methyl-accepting chemotaxis protein
MGGFRMQTRLLALVMIALAGLLVVSITALLSQRSTLLTDRQQKVHSMIEAAYGVIASDYALETSGKLSRQQAQQRAIEQLRGLRYEGKEYFWINDMTPTVVMHPIKPELEGKDVSGMADPNGKHQFVEFVNIVKAHGEGFVDYMWSKPGLDKPVPKLSFVKGFEPWGWIVGTGIYIDDVDAAFWRNSATLLAVSGVTVALMLALGLAIAQRLIRQLGGEPAYTVGVVQHIAAGRLDTEIALRPNDQDSLLARVHGMQLQLRELIGRIRSSTDAIGEMAETVAARSAAVADGSLRQREAASSMAAAVNQMNSSIQQIAASSERARQLSAESGHASQAGHEVIERATGEMHGLDAVIHETASVIDTLVDKTQTITGIVNVIHDVADQTNLLALNAAIEAARAGEMGRGFAVVADEVRKLAERTSAATGEIGSMIADVQHSSAASKNTMGKAVERVEASVELTGQGGQAISQIESSAGRVVGVVEEISSALREQTHTNSLVAQQVERIASSADDNAAAAGAAAEVITSMRDLTVQLRSAVGCFRI